MEVSDIEEMVEQINCDIQLLKNKSLYELNPKKGNPKCSTLANRMDKNLRNVTIGYKDLVEEKKEVADREHFDTLRGMLQKISREFSLLSKKQPDKLLNPFKIKQVNRILMPLRKLMKEEMSGQFLELVEEIEGNQTESRNSYSDVSVILCQYEEACHEYNLKYYEHDNLFGFDIK